MQTGASRSSSCCTEKGLVLRVISSALCHDDFSHAKTLVWKCCTNLQPQKKSLVSVNHSPKRRALHPCASSNGHLDGGCSRPCPRVCRLYCSYCHVTLQSLAGLSSYEMHGATWPCQLPGYGRRCAPPLSFACRAGSNGGLAASVSKTFKQQQITPLSQPLALTGQPQLGCVSH